MESLKMENLSISTQQITLLCSMMIMMTTNDFYKQIQLLLIFLIQEALTFKKLKI